MTDYHKRLKLARERVGKSPQAIAAAVGVSVGAYYDLEWVEGEIESGVSLGTIQRLCGVLGIHSSDLFDFEPMTSAKRVSLNQLVSRIKSHLLDKHLTILEFENIVGFEIRRCLEDISSILEWDIECLRYVCEEIGVDWKSALPTDGEQVQNIKIESPRG
jgi:transcriptional regulator with XRE-family HTH domain